MPNSDKADTADKSRNGYEQSKKRPHKEFGDRMVRICDADQMIPSANYGRYAWIADQFKKRFDVEVSRETVRRWAAGESFPRPKMMDHLAEVLRTSRAWLAYGRKPDLSEKEKRQRTLSEVASTNLVSGFIQMNGGSCALPDDGESDLSLVAIIGGKHLTLTIVTLHSAGNVVEFNVPTGTDLGMVIGVHKTSQVSVDMFVIPSEVIQNAGVSLSPDTIKVEGEIKKNKLIVGENEISAIIDMRRSLTN